MMIQVQFEITIRRKRLKITSKILRGSVSTSEEWTIADAIEKMNMELTRQVADSVPGVKFTSRGVNLE